MPRPLIELRLFRSRGFRAAAMTTFLLGAALFGTLLVLPLYFQVGRGESALDAGLLIAPQGVGAATSLFIGGRLTDRHGGGSVAAVGCTVLALATLPLMFVSADTPYALLGAVLFARGPGFGAAVQPTAAAAYALLGAVLFARGLGFGAAVQPTAAAAYALLDSLQVPRRSGTRSRGRGCWRL